MKKLIINEKIIRKRMIDMNIKTINELSIKSKVSKPTIYDYFNGKSPVSIAFINLCNFLEVDPSSTLIEVEEKKND